MMVRAVLAVFAVALVAAPAASAGTVRLPPAPGTPPPVVAQAWPSAQSQGSHVKPSLRMQISRLRSIYATPGMATIAASNWDISHSFCQASLHGYTGTGWAPDDDVRRFWDYIVAVVGSATFKPYQTRWVATARPSDGHPREKLALDMKYYSNGAWYYWGAYYAWGDCWYDAGYHDNGWTGA